MLAVASPLFWFFFFPGRGGFGFLFMFLIIMLVLRLLSGPGSRRYPRGGYGPRRYYGPGYYDPNAPRPGQQGQDPGPNQYGPNVPGAPASSQPNQAAGGAPYVADAGARTIRVEPGGEPSQGANTIRVEPGETGNSGEPTRPL